MFSHYATKFADLISFKTIDHFKVIQSYMRVSPSYQLGSTLELDHWLQDIYTCTGNLLDISFYSSFLRHMVKDHQCTTLLEEMVCNSWKNTTLFHFQLHCGTSHRPGLLYTMETPWSLLTNLPRKKYCVKRIHRPVVLFSALILSLLADFHIPLFASQSLDFLSLILLPTSS